MDEVSACGFFVVELRTCAGTEALVMMLCGSRQEAFGPV